MKNGSLAAADLSSGALQALIPVTPYSKTESDARYLRSTIAEVKSFKLGEGSGETSSKEVTCPAGYQASGGGVDTSNTLNDRVSASTPTFAGQRPEQSIGPGEHQEGPATGWFGAITVQGAREVSPCVPRYEPRGRASLTKQWRKRMITFGIICLIVAAIFNIGFLWALGVILIVLGAIFWILGAMGRAVGGRRHYY